MARRQVVTLIDDVDGSEAAGTLFFTVDGHSYEIELSEKNRAKFDKAVAPFVNAGRKVRGAVAPSSSRRRAGTAAGGTRSDLGDVRAWARSQGYEVSDRGRVAAEITEAYDAAH